MIIEIDAGNSRLKWRALSEADEPALNGAPESLIAETLREIADSLNDGGNSVCRPSEIRLASVRSPDSLAALARDCQELFAVAPSIVRVAREQAGVAIQYTDPSRLVVDRWLAMLAAKARSSGGCLVVDSGTAMTIDQLSAEGCHEGGYIVPGLALMRQSLTENTRIRLDPDYALGGAALGHSTDAAVYHGCIAASVAVIREAWLALFAQDPQARLYITGGGAGELSAHLQDCAPCHVPDLVLDGLSLAFG